MEVDKSLKHDESYSDTEVNCRYYEDNFLHLCESFVDTLSFSDGVTPALSPSQSNQPPASSAKSPKTNVIHASFPSFHEFFRAEESRSYSVKDIFKMLKYKSQNGVGELYQLQGMNHHLFLPRSQVYKDILHSVQTYDPDSSFNMENWTLHVIESIHRVYTEDPNNPVETNKRGLKDQWFPLKSASSLEDGVLKAEGNLNLSDYKEGLGHSLFWNVMDGMHRSVALCDVYSALGKADSSADSSADLSPSIENLKVNVVVYKLKGVSDLKTNDFEKIIESVTRNSAGIRDLNHNLTGTSHEAILLMLISSSFRIDVPSFQPTNNIRTPMEKFIKKVNMQAQKQLQAITNLNISEGCLTKDHMYSPSIKQDSIKRYFQQSYKKSLHNKSSITEPPNQMLAQLSAHLITIGTALSFCHSTVAEMIARHLKDLDGYLNESKLGKKEKQRTKAIF